MDDFSMIKKSEGRKEKLSEGNFFLWNKITLNIFFRWKVLLKLNILDWKLHWLQKFSYTKNTNWGWKLRSRVGKRFHPLCQALKIHLLTKIVLIDLKSPSNENYAIQLRLGITAISIRFDFLLRNPILAQRHFVPIHFNLRAEFFTNKPSIPEPQQ